MYDRGLARLTVDSFNNHRHEGLLKKTDKSSAWVRFLVLSDLQRYCPEIFNAAGIARIDDPHSPFLPSKHYLDYRVTFT